MKVIIAGDRNFTDYEYVKKFVDSLEIEITEVVSGRARGVDRLGERYAKENEIECMMFPAEWGTYGRAAGPIRNKQMADYVGEEGALIAFLAEGSKGTASMISIAEKQNIQTFIAPVAQW